MNSTSPSKRCNDCGETKTLSEFYPHKGMKDGFTNTCRTCDKIRRARTKTRTVYTPETRKRNNEHVRASKYRKTYEGKITPNQYDTAIVWLEGRCQLCDTRAAQLCVDFRDHEVKGLLCQKCLLEMRRWKDVDLDAVEEVARVTDDPILKQRIHYFKNPPGIKESSVRQA
jgi:hypothetical protein